MRYIMKGGVWKNSQDQILKAAIMKYGLNQWSRISSLLQRKSAKQCKQRWYQWLDPSIKKTQWSRAEDEKLLQLARVFPSQWRTIAPFVGRTPTQCFQRYQKLLDLAQGKTGQQTEDLKRLRPGQIDPNPETKPARLDPIDMDEDQKQMLAEVRVRLANTKGKKAKRKQREKIIQEARRLAQLQKIRQLQMAGVDNIPTAKQIKRMRQKQDIDYNKQIPFKRQIPQFVYKTQQNQTSKSSFFASTISLQTLQGKRRDVQEQLQRKIDKKRLKRLKDTDYKAMMALKSRFEKPVQTPIQLPEPQLNQKDLEEMKKFNITTPLNSLMHNATPYGMTPQNKIMLSAKVNWSLNHRDLMTPVGEDQQQDQVDGIQGLNYLKQLQKKQKETSKLKSVQRLISQRSKTPLAGNDWQQDQGAKVKSLFKNLRKPQNIIQFQIPQQQQEEQAKQQQFLMDAQQQQKIQATQQQRSQKQKLNLRNQTLKLKLQRVKNIPNKFNPSKSKQQSQILVQQQMINMLYSDAIDYPLDTFSLPQQHNFIYLAPLSTENRNLAMKLIQEECLKTGMYKQEEYLKKYQQAQKHIHKDYKNKKATKREKQIAKDQLQKESYCKQFVNSSIYKQLQKSNEQQEKRAKKFLGGYQKLISTKIQQINNLQQQLQQLRMQRQTLQVLAEHEAKSAVQRLQRQEKYYKTIYNSI